MHNSKMQEQNVQNAKFADAKVIAKVCLKLKWKYPEKCESE